jgi:hypothetical protein
MKAEIYRDKGREEGQPGLNRHLIVTSSAINITPVGEVRRSQRGREGRRKGGTHVA